MTPLTPLFLLRTLVPTSPHPLQPDTAAAEPAWRQAYGRHSATPSATPSAASSTSSRDERRMSDDGTLPSPADATPLWAALAPVPWYGALPDAPPSPPAARIEPASPTVARMAEAARRIAEPVPTAGATLRIWQVELPGAAPGWQLHIEQQQPQAPLALELRVPPVVAAHAQQQLADLDRRLRDAGHELLRSRLRQGGRAERRRPVDEVDS